MLRYFTFCFTNIYIYIYYSVLSDGLRKRKYVLPAKMTEHDMFQASNQPKSHVAYCEVYSPWEDLDLKDPFSVVLSAGGAGVQWRSEKNRFRGVQSRPQITPSHG